MTRDTYALSDNLTKAFLMSLREGAYLVSNVYWCLGMPMFAEPVAALAERQQQWLRIRDAGVNGCRCFVYHSQKEYEAEDRAFVSRQLRKRPDLRYEIFAARRVFEREAEVSPATGRKKARL